MSNGKHPAIRHIVYLMLENRSLDNVLGWLYEHEHPANVLPAGSSAHFEGLRKDMYCLDDRGGKHYVVRGTGGRNAVPRFDPNETFEHVHNQLFGVMANPDASTAPMTDPAKTDVPEMNGFYKDYAKW